MGHTNAMLIGRIAGIWADFVSNDELDKAQQRLVAVLDKVTLREALLDTVRQTVRGAPRRTESDDNSWKEVLSDPPLSLASRSGGKPGSRRKKAKP